MGRFVLLLNANPRFTRLTLHTSVTGLAVLPSNGHTATPHVTHLLGVAIGGVARRKLGRHRTRFALVRVKFVDEGRILLHRLGDSVPEGGIERSISRPRRVDGVGVSGRVFVGEDRAGVGERGECGNIGVPGVGFVDLGKRFC